MEVDQDGNECGEDVVEIGRWEKDAETEKREN